MILQGAVIRQVVSRDVWTSAAFTVVVASRGSVNKFPGKCLSRQLSVQIIFVRHFLFQRSCVKVCLPINPFQGVETETRNYAHVPLKCASVRGMGKRELLSAGDPRLPKGGPGRPKGGPGRPPELQKASKMSQNEAQNHKKSKNGGRSALYFSLCGSRFCRQSTK